MKNLIFILFFFLAITGKDFAQVSGDSSDTKGNQNKEMIKGDNSNRPGIGERHQLQQGKNKRKMDVFIDKDGDGICDNRASGMGLDKMRKRYRSGSSGSGGQGNGSGGDNGSGGSGGGNGNGGSGGR